MVDPRVLLVPLQVEACTETIQSLLFCRGPQSSLGCVSPKTEVKGKACKQDSFPPPSTEEMLFRALRVVWPASKLGAVEATLAGL